MIRTVKIQNFRSFSSQEVELKPLTLLVGPNGAGKTNFLNALALVGQLARRSVEEAFGTGPRAFEQVLFRGAPVDSSILLAVTLDELELTEGRDCARYSVGLRRTSPEAPYEITSEQLDIWSTDTPENVETVFATDDKRKVRFDGQSFATTRNSLLFMFRGNERFPDIGTVARGLSRQRSYRIDPWVAGRPCEDLDTNDLGHDGRNLPSVLHSLRSMQPEAFEAVEESLRRALPEFRRLTLPVIGQQQRALGIIEAPFESPFTARELSDGTMIMIAFLTLANLDSAPSLIAIEEIERGLNPTRVAQLIDTFRGLTEEDPDHPEPMPRQVIITTHAPFVLDRFADAPEDVLVVHREEGVSRIMPLIELPNAKQQLRESVHPARDAWYSEVLGV